MSSPVDRASVGQISQVQYAQAIEKPETSAIDRLPTQENAAAQQKTKLETFKANVSDLLERSKGSLAIGAGASLLGLSVVSGITLAPLTIPGAFLGGAIGAAAAKSESTKAAFGGKGNLVKTGLTIGTCLIYGLGLLGAKLIEYGTDKNRMNKDSKPAPAGEKASVPQKAVEKETISEVANKPPEAAEKSMSQEGSQSWSKPTLEQLEAKLENLKNSHREEISPQFKDSLGDKLEVAKKASDGFQRQIDAEEESISYCKETISNISDKYEGPDNAKFNDMLGKYMLTPRNKREDFLKNLNNADQVMTNKGYVAMDQIRKDIKSVGQNMSDIAQGKKLISESFTKQKMEFDAEVEELSNELNVLTDAYNNEVASLESQIKGLSESSAKPKLTDEEVLAQQMKEARSHHIH